MKLFSNYEAIKFYQENLIFITHNGFLYYIYNPKYKHWRKHLNAGNDHITVANYDDLTQKDKGRFCVFFGRFLHLGHT